MTAIFLVLALSQTPSNWNDLKQTVSGKSGKHSYRIEIECTNFQPRSRTLSWVKDGYNYFPAIAGRRVWGIDGWGKDDIKRMPVTDFLKKRATEIRKFRISVDGKTWRVPTTFTRDLLNLNLRSEVKQNTFNIQLAKDGSTLTFRLGGSDGGGGYQADFFLRKNGRPARQILIESVVAQTIKG